MNGRVQYAMLRKWIPLATSKERGEPHGRHGRVNDRRMMPSRRLRFDGDFGTPGNRKTLETRHCESRQNEHVALAKNHRKAFTLVEILLVLGVLVVFAGMTVPSVMRMFSEQKITGSAERVREAIAMPGFGRLNRESFISFAAKRTGLGMSWSLLSRIMSMRTEDRAVRSRFSVERRGLFPKVLFSVRR